MGKSETGSSRFVSKNFRGGVRAADKALAKLLTDVDRGKIRSGAETVSDQLGRFLKLRGNRQVGHHGDGLPKDSQQDFLHVTLPYPEPPPPVIRVSHRPGVMRHPDPVKSSREAMANSCPWQGI